MMNDTYDAYDAYFIFSFINSKQKNNIFIYIHNMDVFAMRHASCVIDDINEKLMLFYIDMLIYHHKMTKIE